MSGRPTAGASAAPAGVEYVGFWARVGAALIDTVWVTLLLAPLLLLVYGARYFTLEHARSGTSDLGELLISYGVPAVLVLAFWRRSRATPGKMLIGAEIVDAATLGAPSLGQLVLRYVGYFVSTLPLGGGLVWVALDAKKRGWHDLLAGTVVIRVRRSGGAR